jgi:hypothetical protein
LEGAEAGVACGGDEAGDAGGSIARACDKAPIHTTVSNPTATLMTTPFNYDWQVGRFREALQA